MNSNMLDDNTVSGRPVGIIKLAGFIHATSFLEENDDEPVSISHLCQLMAENRCEPYSTKFMKKKLIEKYKEKLVIVSSIGLPDAVSLQTIDEKIIMDFYKTPKGKGTEEEKIRIIQAAATIIRNEIKNVNCRNDIYDIFDGLSDEKEAIAFIPVSLKIFIRSILVAKGSQDKIISLGQDIMQSAWRKVVAPYQV